MNKKTAADNTVSQKRLLIIDDEENMRHMLSSLLKKSGYRVDTASNGKEALEMVDQTLYDFILCDLKMPDISGMEFFEIARDKLWATTVIMMSAYGSIDIAVEAMKKGAYDFISKPFKSDEVLLTLKKAEERESLKRENLWLKERIRKIQENYHFGNMVAKSKAMNAVFKLAEKVAQYNTTVLIYGDSGTGKELVSKAIHEISGRKKGPFVKVNCAALTESLLESELFGHVKGAFTGAYQNREGRFEKAHGGNIFLDEIGDLPLSTQVKLLRVIEDKIIERVGDSQSIPVDVRIISATNRNLTRLVDEGVIRKDFYFRINVIPINLPPLRERLEDIPLLAEFFFRKNQLKSGKNIQGINNDTMDALVNYWWPGNVRELKGAFEYAFVTCQETMIKPHHLPLNITDKKKSLKVSQRPSLNREEIKKLELIETLKRTNGNQSEAARILGVTRVTIWNRMKRFGIYPDRKNPT